MDTKKVDLSQLGAVFRAVSRLAKPEGGTVDASVVMVLTALIDEVVGIEVHEFTPVNTAQFINRLQTSRPTVYRSLDKGEAWGLIERHRGYEGTKPRGFVRLSVRLVEEIDRIIAEGGTKNE